MALMLQIIQNTRKGHLNFSCVFTFHNSHFLTIVHNSQFLTIVHNSHFLTIVHLYIVYNKQVSAHLAVVSW